RRAPLRVAANPSWPSPASPGLLFPRAIWSCARHGGRPMFRRFAFIALSLMPVGAAAQQPAAPPANPAPAARFKWQANQTLTYKLTQQTVVRETVLDEKTEKPVTTVAQTNLTLVRKWTVK